MNAFDRPVPTLAQQTQYMIDAVNDPRCSTPGRVSAAEKRTPRKRHRWNQPVTYALKRRHCLACGVTAHTFGVGAGRIWSYEAANGRLLGTKSPLCPPPEPAMTETTAPFSQGDLVRYVPTGERWNVDSYVPATPYKPARVILGRSWSIENGVHAEILDAAEDDVYMITRSGERSMIVERHGDLMIACDKGGDVIGSWRAE